MYFVFPVSAQNSPNNKFGIHLATPQDEDLKRADELVNSTGGDWGYITLVIEERDRDIQKWQGIFDKLREHHLIPIIRLATQPEGNNWRRPEVTDVQSWIDFLNKLNWVTKKRYIILFNEPNHATEWGGGVDIDSYSQIAEYYARVFTRSSEDYVIMPAGFDAAAPSQPPKYEEIGIFIRGMVERIGVNDMNTLFGAWSSHSYPNPGFVGPANASGKGTVRSYRWEIGELQRLGVKELPVFITETGWDGRKLSRDVVATNFQNAYQYVWLPDPLVKAVTPFILNYQTDPFLQFSWVRQGNDGVYPEYEAVKGMVKIAGKPRQEENGFFYFDLPSDIVQNSTYHFQFELENAGQSIWEKDSGYEIALEGLQKTQYIVSNLGKIKPGEKRLFDVYVTTTGMGGDQQVQFAVKKDGEPAIKSGVWKFAVVPIPSLTISTSLFPKIQTTDDDFEVQVFDEYEQLVFRIRDMRMIRGEGTVESVENIALGRKYRIVLLKPYYLPRQTYVRFAKDNNVARFERMLPFDFDADGALSLSDMSGLLKQPALIKNLLP